MSCTVRRVYSRRNRQTGNIGNRPATEYANDIGRVADVAGVAGPKHKAHVRIHEFGSIRRRSIINFLHGSPFSTGNIGNIGNTVVFVDDYGDPYRQQTGNNRQQVSLQTSYVGVA